MREISVVPGESIGPAKLGMTEEDINKIVSETRIYFNAETNNGLVSHIEAAQEAGDRFIFNEIDLLHTKVTELIPLLDSVSPYDRRHHELGYTYIFTIFSKCWSFQGRG